MLTIPAKVAGVRRIAACSPSVKESESIDPKTLVAMDIGGARNICGRRSQAIAAFAYGTGQTLRSLVVGPGNQYVTEAKRQCYGKIGIDFVAGPSEVLVMAEEGAGASAHSRSDLLAQAEHDPLAKEYL